MRNHFSKFGTIVRVTLNVKANQAQISFVNHEAAALAKKQGKTLHPNLPNMMIFFATAARPRSDDNPADIVAQKKSNAMKVLRQSSSESQDKTRRLIRKSSRESLKDTSESASSNEKHERRKLHELDKLSSHVIQK